jgi:two-component system chemotaxis response regulator CheB
MSHPGAIMYAAAPAPTPVDSAAEAPIRVMIVDDSAVVRGLVARWLDEEPGIEVVARHANGKLAVADVARSAPDIVLLDVEMPVMDGLEALPLLLEAKPGVRVLMVSTLTKRNAEISFKALALGAIDYLPKPDSNFELTLSADFRGEVIRKVKALGPVRRHARVDEEAPQVSAGAAQARLAFSYRPFSLVPPRVIAIGSSTGGPQVLSGMLGTLSSALLRVPVLIAQHMPPVFTAILAERLTKATGREVKEGRDGEPVKPGTIYVAPGGHHMTVMRPTSPVLRIGDEPPVHFCRPAIDPLFKSVAYTFGPASLGIVLTGMGHDGAAGARSIADAGGSVIAQDEESSVVWGMPAAAASVGACAALLPPNEIATVTAKLVRGMRP